MTKCGDMMMTKTNKSWAIDELLKMLDCLVTETSEPINDSYTNGFVDGYNRALENIRFIVCTRKEG